MPRLKLGIEFVLADGAGILSRGKNSGIFNMTMMMVTMMVMMMMVVIVMTMVKKKHCETLLVFAEGGQKTGIATCRSAH